jgi:hypothetical protein
LRMSIAFAACYLEGAVSPELATVAAVPAELNEVLEVVHRAFMPPETCQKIPKASSASRAVRRQYSERSCPWFARKNLRITRNT